MQGLSFPRPITARDLLATDKVVRQAIHEYETLGGVTAPAAGASLPSIGGLQEYKTGDRFAEDIICAGTLLRINDIYGVLLHDSIAGNTNATYVVRGRFRLNCAALTYAVGEKLFVTISTGVLTNVDSGGTEVYLGRAESLIQTDPLGFPTGSYIDIFIDQVNETA